MCRFIAYFGKNPKLISELLERPENSLIRQSHHAREGLHGINGDGFGLAWYNPKITPNPGVFKSKQPAWNDNNLIHLARMIESECFLSHVRASTVGDVSRTNCHPFIYDRFAIVHNGTIRHFDKIRRSLLALLDDELFGKVKGNTDSECFFFLIIHFMRSKNQTLIEATKEAVHWVVAAQSKDSDDHFSRINIAITNGQELLATRFVSKEHGSLSLNYSASTDKNGLKSIILSSEALTDCESNWVEMKENSYLYVNQHSMQIETGDL